MINSGCFDQALLNTRYSHPLRLRTEGTVVTITTYDDQRHCPRSGVLDEELIREPSLADDNPKCVTGSQCPHHSPSNLGCIEPVHGANPDPLVDGG